MMDIKVFRVSLRGDFTVYSSAEDIHELCAIINDGAEAMINIYDLSVNCISVSNTLPITEGWPAGRICKLVKEEGHLETNVFSLDSATESEARQDYENSNLFNDKSSNAVGTASFWIETFHEHLSKKARFGRLLATPSTFPRIDSFESDNLLTRFRQVDDIYKYWCATRNGLLSGEWDSQERDENHEHVLSYYGLRYPLLEDCFQMLFAADVEKTAC